MKEYQVKSKDQIINVWKQAAKVLAITIEAPFSFTSGGKVFDCIAFLPDFGSENGMVIDGITGPNFDTQEGLQSATSEKGWFISFVNMEEYSVFDEKMFKETLADWGYYGRQSKKPNWITQ
jgi:hypothetical protein